MAKQRSDAKPYLQIWVFYN